VYGGFQNRHVVNVRDQESILKRIEPILYSCAKRECLGLPPVTVQIMPLKLTAQAQHRVLTNMRELRSQIKEAYACGGPVMVNDLSARLIMAHRLAGGVIPDDTGEMRWFHDVKLKAFDALLEIIDGRRVVVFCRFLAEMTALREHLEEKGLKPCVIYGGTPTERRGLELKRFREEEGTILLMQESMGIGINLTAASYCIFFSFDYSYTSYKQALDRLDRPGQVTPVTCYVLMTQGSIDESIWKVVQAKGEVNDLLVGLSK
jgi:SNF2 family DNA or RNA helicase